MPGDSAPDDPDPTAAAEPPPEIEEARDVLTPMGQVDSVGSFARGLGARRMRIVIFAFGAVAMLIALLNALN